MQSKENQEKDVTQLLIQWGRGEKQALNELMPVVYDELCQIAARYMRRERADHTLQASALVHDAYLRLIDQKNTDWKSRAHFFGVAANIMRRILVDHARRHKSEKRGGLVPRLSLTHADRIARQEDLDLIALDEALRTLAQFDPQQSKIVELRFFGGLTIEETAEILGVSDSTVERDWTLARAWLHRELSRKKPNSE